MTDTLAVYITPPPEDTFYQLASTFIGYDIWSQRITPNVKYAKWVGGAAKFGFHCTIGDALVYKRQDLEEIGQRLSRICAQFKPFTLSNFHLNHNFWAGVPLLVLGFSEPSGELCRLASSVTTTINPLYVDSPYYPKLLHLLPKYREDYFVTYGAPQVLEHYLPHFTLASSIPDQTAKNTLVEFLEAQVLFPKHDYTLLVDRLHLVRQKSDGFYEILESYGFGT